MFSFLTPSTSGRRFRDSSQIGPHCRNESYLKVPEVTVEYRDRWRTVECRLNSPPLIDPPGLEVLERGVGRIVYGPGSGEDTLGGSDLVVGSIPMAYMEGASLKIGYLDVPPPVPLTTDMLLLMWEEVASLGLEMPHGIALQGRLLPGAFSPASALLTDVLDRAHASARVLLARWPREERESSLWRGLELPGGREDLHGTARVAGRLPAQPGPRGTLLPVRSLRRIPSHEEWRSHRLHTAAALLADRADRAMSGVSSEARRLLQRPFLGVADMANPGGRRSDPPVSTWPDAARSCYRTILAALSVLDAIAADRNAPRAPLCHLWRLYEAWVAATCFRVLDNAGMHQIFGPQRTSAGEWSTCWERSDGGRVAMVAQAQIGRHPETFDGVLPTGIRSVSSDLRPDVLICVVRPDNAVGIVALDAKRRSASNMDARDASESASKYVWGLRVGAQNSGRDPGTAHVSATLLATTAAAPTMNEPASRIAPLRLLPDAPVVELALALDQAIDLANREARY
jgi:hypothetical protein